VNGAPKVSVVIATHDRPDSIERLVRQLGAQSLPGADFEIVVVDDGSAEAVEPRLRRLGLPCALTVLTEENAGAARARHRGITAARGDLIVITDDDMQVSPDFLARHVSAHPVGSHQAVLGWVRLDRPEAMPLFERQYGEHLERLAAEVAAGLKLGGTQLYTGNVSFRRRDYLAIGGFDPSLGRSEDAELGVRLVKAGVILCFSEAARTRHNSDHACLEEWMRRAFEYGVWDLRVSRKHRDVSEASPWRFLTLVSPISLPMLLAAVVVPSCTRRLARLAMAVALAVDRLGASRLALAGANFVWGLEYFRGVRAESGSMAETIADLQRHRYQRHAVRAHSMTPRQPECE
jgi:glycosyltransferase involved in cell wall biosynthesis